MRTLAPRSAPDRRWRRTAFFVAALAIGSAGAVGATRLHAQDDEGNAPAEAVGDKVASILAKMDRVGLPGAWDRAIELEKLGAPAAPEISKRLEGAKLGTKLAAAKAILSIEGATSERPAAIRALKDVVLSDAPRDARLAAADLLASVGQKEEVRPLQRELDSIKDPIVKIGLLKALRAKGKVVSAADGLKEFLKSDDLSLRAEAALALGECGNVDIAKDILEQLSHEPTERGRRASALLEREEALKRAETVAGLEKKDDIVKFKDKQIRDLQAQIESMKAAAKKGDGAGATDVPGGPLMKELFDKIRALYVDEKKATNEKALVDAAAKGLIDVLDPFSQYMTEDELKKFDEGIKQQYAGIGAVVAIDPKSQLLQIVRPIYGGPAHKAGLRSLDKVTEVEGVSTKGKTVVDLVGVLKGPQGTKVHIKVKPFLEPDAAVKEMTITRDFISLPSVRYDLLPGKIGYLMLEQFGARASEEVETALKDLESRGMVGLIFDLRGNPGGLLQAAVDICAKFLPEDKLIVYQEGRKGTRVGARKEFRTTADDTPHPNYPVVLLVDENSASASEIVSGCLQAHKRAELVGQQTFGKGSVQQVYQVGATEGKSALRLTIAYYYLPDGRCIHRPRNPKSWKYRELIRSEIERWKQDGHINEGQAKILLDQYKLPPGGVVPDFLVEQDHFPTEKAKPYAEVIDSGKLETYVQKHWATNKDALHALAGYDAFDPERYPDFDAFYGDLKTELTKDDVRKLLRATVRRFTQDDLAKVYPSDFQEDGQLQAAVLTIENDVGAKIADVPELGFISKKFPKGLERTPAAALKPAPAEPEDDDEEAPRPPKKDDKKKDDKRDEKKKDDKKDEEKKDKREDF